MSVFSCKDTVWLASVSLDGDLAMGQLLALHAHLLMCPLCARFRRHLQFLHDAARLLEDRATWNGVDQANLSPAARTRMHRALGPQE
jgi:hypothetical protein